MCWTPNPDTLSRERVPRFLLLILLNLVAPVPHCKLFWTLSQVTPLRLLQQLAHLRLHQFAEEELACDGHVAWFITLCRLRNPS